MNWTESEEYQKLLVDAPKLQDEKHREAFEKYVDRMWTCPSDYRGFLQAYMEFTTPKRPRMPRLQQTKKKKTQRKRRRSSRRRRRSRRKRKRKS